MSGSIDCCYLDKTVDIFIQFFKVSTLLKAYQVYDLLFLFITSFNTDNINNKSCNRCQLLFCDFTRGEHANEKKKKEKKEEKKKRSELIISYWMRLSIISWIIKTEIWVVFWTQRTRKITQTQT